MENLEFWQRVYGEFFKCADKNAWKSDHVGTPSWIGDANSYQYSFGWQNDAKYSDTGWGRLHTFDRFELVRVVWVLNNALTDLNVGSSYDITWSWENSNYRNKTFRTAIPYYSIFFSMANKPWEPKEFSFNDICLFEHELIDIGDMFSLAREFPGIKDSFNCYRWTSSGLMLGCELSKIKAAKIKKKFEKFLADDIAAQKIKSIGIVPDEPRVLVKFG